jgi:hypothetical protein
MFAHDDEGLVDPEDDEAVETRLLKAIRQVSSAGIEIP